MLQNILFNVPLKPLATPSITQLSLKKKVNIKRKKSPCNTQRAIQPQEKTLQYVVSTVHMHSAHTHTNKQTQYYHPYILPIIYVFP